MTLRGALNRIKGEPAYDSLCKLKEELGLATDTEVLRFALTFTYKRLIKEKELSAVKKE